MRQKMVPAARHQITPSSMPSCTSGGDRGLGTGGGPPCAGVARQPCNGNGGEMIDDRRILLPKGVVVDSLEAYKARGGFKGLEKAFQMKPQDVINEIKKS